MQTLLGFILSMSVTMVLIPLLVRWAGPLHILDMPGARKVHASPVPRIGGIAMVLGVLLATLLWGVTTRAMHALQICIAILLVFGVWDDRSSLSAGPKFAGQALAVLIAMFWGGISVAAVTFTERMLLPAWIAMPLTFVFLVGGTNAFNLADGLDGLAGGMAMLCLCGTALLAYTVGNLAVGGVAVVIVGALVGFLRFNTHPARVFMGDGGSQVLGFSAAFLALLLTQDPQIPLSTALPLLLLGMPIIDTLMVMSERMLEGRSPFLADRRHIHHRLLGLGFEHWEAVSILYLLQCALFVAAWFMRYDSDLTVAMSFLAFAAVVVLALRITQYLDVRVRAVAVEPVVNSAATPAESQQERRSLRPLGVFLLAAAMAFYAIWVLWTGAQPAADVQILALSLAAILGVGLLWRWKRLDASWTDKIALYSSAALAIYLSKHGLTDAFQIQSVHNAVPHLVESVVFAVLALAMVLCMRSSSERPFKVTPLDILVLLIVITVPNLPDSVASAKSLGLTIAELVLLFYSVEALYLAVGPRWRWLSGAAAIFLVGMVVRGGFGS